MGKLPSLVNGVVSEHISVHDRGLLYGQSVFETIAVEHTTPLLLEPHLHRLARGCRMLAIDYDKAALLTEIEQLCQSMKNGVLRIALTIGPGGRGYKNPQIQKSTRILSCHQFAAHLDKNWLDGITLGLSEVKLGHQPMLAGIKHSNRLEQILARANWHNDWQEALLCDQQGNVIEATQSNVFIRRGKDLLTPKLDQAGVAGVMRDFVLNNAQKLGSSVERMRLSIADIESADEIFLTNSIIGLWPIKRFANRRYDDHQYSHQLLHLMRENGAVPTH